MNADGPRSEQPNSGDVVASGSNSHLYLGEVETTIVEALRYGRHRADLSQRELAAAAGLSSSMVARAEVGDLSVSLRALAVLLERLDLQLVIADRDGVPIGPDSFAEARDRGGRRFPAHLRVRRLTKREGDWWGDMRWGYVLYHHPQRPQFTFDRRDLRDERLRLAAARRVRDEEARRVREEEARQDGARPARPEETPQPPSATGCSNADGSATAAA